MERKERWREARGCLGGCVRWISLRFQSSRLQRSESIAAIKRRRRSLKTVEDKEEYDFVLQQAVTRQLLKALRPSLPKDREGCQGIDLKHSSTQNSSKGAVEVWRYNSYKGVDVTFPITYDVAERLRHHYERQSGGVKALKDEDLAKLLEIFAQGYHARRPSSVAEVGVPPSPGKLVIVGDTHGQLEDVLLIFHVHGPPTKDNVYLFNGDIADRGPNAVEIFTLLAAYFLAEPGSIVINRGNHEDVRMNQLSASEGGGFFDEVRYKYSEALYWKFITLFKTFNLCTVVGEKVFVVHGGLSSIKHVTLDMIRQIDHTATTMPEQAASGLEQLWIDMLWSDPHPDQGCFQSDRGIGCMFGPNKTREFFQSNMSIKIVIRSHELPLNNTGFDLHHHNRLVTLFSASNYGGDSANKAAVLLLTEQNFPTGEFYEYYSPTLDMIARLSGASPNSTLTERWMEAGEQLFQDHNRGIQCNEAAWRKELQRVMVAIVERKPDIWDKFMELTKGAALVDSSQWEDILSSVLVTKWNWTAAWDHWGLGDANGKVNFVDFLRRFTVVLTREEFISFKLSAISSVYHKLLDCDMPLKDAIKQFDADEDGLVTVAEMRSALRSLGLGLVTAQLDVILHGVFRGRDSLTDEEFFSSIALVFRRAEVTLAVQGETEEQRLFAEAMERIAHAVAVTPMSQLSTQSQLRRVSSATSQGPAKVHSKRIGTDAGMKDVMAEKFTIVFAIMDEDHNGELDTSEFVSGLWALPTVRAIRLSNGQPMSESFLQQLSRWLDRNGSGSISIFEFLGGFEVEDPLSSLGLADALAENIISVLLRHRHSIRAGVALFDSDWSGFISKDDFRKVLIALNDSIEETGHHWSTSQVDDFCEALATESAGDQGLPAGSFVEYETVFDSLQVVDSQFPESGVRLGRRYNNRLRTSA